MSVCACEYVSTPTVVIELEKDEEGGRCAVDMPLSYFMEICLFLPAHHESMLWGTWFERGPTMKGEGHFKVDCMNIYHRWHVQAASLSATTSLLLSQMMLMIAVLLVPTAS